MSKENGVKAAFANENQRGLTKREYFATMALQGCISNSGNRKTSEELAEAAVKLADALLMELEK